MFLSDSSYMHKISGNYDQYLYIYIFSGFELGNNHKEFPELMYDGF